MHAIAFSSILLPKRQLDLDLLRLFLAYESVLDFLELPVFSSDSPQSSPNHNYLTLPVFRTLSFGTASQEPVKQPGCGTCTEPPGTSSRETPAKPRKRELRHESRVTTEVGQARGEEEVNVVHLLNSLHDSREDLALMTAA